jgi:hypothetical protein
MKRRKTSGGRCAFTGGQVGCPNEDTTTVRVRDLIPAERKQVDLDGINVDESVKLVFVSVYQRL